MAKVILSLANRVLCKKDSPKLFVAALSEFLTECIRWTNSPVGLLARTGDCLQVYTCIWQVWGLPGQSTTNSTHKNIQTTQHKKSKQHTTHNKCIWQFTGLVGQLAAFTITTNSPQQNTQTAQIKESKQHTTNTNDKCGASYLAACLKLTTNKSTNAKINRNWNKHTNSKHWTWNTCTLQVWGLPKLFGCTTHNSQQNTSTNTSMTT